MANSKQPDAPAGRERDSGDPARSWARGRRRRAATPAAWALGGSGVALWQHPALSEVLTAVAVTIVLGVIVAMATAVLAGGGPCERVFRLLRLLLDRREPPGQRRS